MGAEQLALEEAVGAFGDAVVRLEVIGYRRSTLSGRAGAGPTGRTLVAGGDVEV
jgi:hypothetical protein